MLLFWTACLRESQAANMEQQCVWEGNGRKPAPLTSPHGWKLHPTGKLASSALSSFDLGQNVCPKASIISIEHKQQASSASNAFHSGWQMVRKVSIRSMTFLLVSHPHRSGDDADDARWSFRNPKKRLCSRFSLMLVLFVRDHLCKALVRLAASYPRALFKRAGDAAFLDRQHAKIPSGQHGTVMHLGTQRQQASTIDISHGLKLHPAGKRATSASSSSACGQTVCPKAFIISIAYPGFLSTNSKHNQQHLLFILGGTWCARQASVA